MTSFYKIGLLILFFFNLVMLHAQSNGNPLDSNGKKHGVWKGVYEESKRPRYEGSFVHGKETGLFKFYDDTKIGSVIATRKFSAVNNGAYTIFYDQKNNKVSEGNVVNKLYDGQWKYYHQASDKVMTIENYKNGKLEGVRTVYYLSGKIAEEAFYVANVKEGSYIKYSENGIVLEESIYKNNEYNGLTIFKDPDGSVVSKGQFINGKKASIWQFFEKGKLVKEVNMSFLQASSKPKRK